MRKILTAKEFGKSLKPPISARRVRVLCAEGRLNAWKSGRDWNIWNNTVDPRKWVRK